MTLDILYQDNHLLAADKPAGLLTQPDPEGRRNNLEDLAKAWVKENFSKPGKVFLHAVHRLDREASGIVLFARTSKALQRMNDLMRRRAIEKTYLAVVAGEPEPREGRLEHSLRHASHRAEVVGENDRDGHQAVLDYRFVQAVPCGSLLKINLITGRYHQIRAQFAAIGCPILGDVRYGSTQAPEGYKGILLHHTRMEFVHPTTSEPIVINSPLPEIWPLG